jgi:hypothetical protein
VTNREERVAKNEAVAREINEGIEDSTAGRSSQGYLRMVCECGRSECELLIAITVPEYEAVRGDPRTFAVAVEHVIADLELVVSETDRFSVVRRREGTPAQVAEATDPRS